MHEPSEIIEWFDTRPQPTNEEINAVSDADADFAALPTSEELMANADPVVRAILEDPATNARVLAALRRNRGK